MTGKVHRSRKTRVEWRIETEDVRVRSGDLPRNYSNEPVVPALVLSFQMKAAGGGVTRVVVSFEPGDFQVLASAMVRRNPGAARRAFDGALKDPRAPLR